MKQADPIRSTPTRRAFLRGGLAAFALTPLAAKAQSNPALSVTEFGVAPNAEQDQSALLQNAFNSAADTGRPLYLPAGRYRATGLALPAGLMVQGVPGATRIVNSGDGPIATAQGATGLTLEGLSFDGQGRGAGETHSGIVAISQCAAVTIDNCAFADVTGNCLYLYATGGQISSTRLNGASGTALFAVDSAGLQITGNTISDCGNGGIRVFRNDSGPDGTLVTENRISNIRSGSGNGQNGNGINIFRADEVIIANNHISDCDFSAVRVNTTNNTLIRGNMISECREVAIFSEFAFSGSIIADNVIDGAAAGISITNFNNGGRLAVCMGNIIRNIWESSPTNPDASSIGIFAEADAAISTNLVENVPGVGIGAGWGEHLRDVLISANVVRECGYGIGVSVAPGAGTARIANNLVSGSERTAIQAFSWTDPSGDDLATNPGQFDNVTVEGNTVS